MTSTLPPDPYLALGVAKDASSATIKSTYRKLVLRCHPDKVTDESLKKQKQEEFHKIQQAYELVGDEEKRATYDAEVKLEQLRKEKLSRNAGSPNVDIKTARYDVRTAAPASATFSTNGPHRYEERKPASRSYDDDRYYDDRSRKYDTYDAYPKHTGSSRAARPEKESGRTARAATDRTRSDQKKSRDREERRDRSGKFVVIEDDSSSADEKARYEADYRRRSDEARRRQDEEEARKVAADARRKAETRRSYDEVKEPRRQRSDEREMDRQRKLDDLKNDAVRYIHRSKVEADPRPSPSRTSSSRDVRQDEYDSRSARRDRDVRRSSARPKDRPEPSIRDRDRKVVPEIVDWESDDRRPPPPSFKHSSSSPADLHVPRTTPQRSFTESSRDHRRTETSPTPLLRRHETMPNQSSSSRRKESVASRPSNLRSSESASPREPDHGSSSPPKSGYATVPPPQSSSNRKLYHYPTPGGGVTIPPENVGVANGHRAILREPERTRHRSPSPLTTRPPMGVNRPSEKGSAQYQPAAPAPPRTTSHTIPPPLGRSSTFNNMSATRGEDRGRARPLYREVPSDYLKPENRRQASFSPDTISYAPKIGPEDIKWAPRGQDDEYAKPSLNRHATTYVC